MEAAFFFQPLNRLATRRLREAAEYLSDEWAVRQTGSAMGLARCLAAVASWVTPEDVSAPHVTMAMAEGGSPLLKRVERLLGQRTPARAPRRAVRAAAAVTILAATVGAAPGITTRDTMRLLEPADVTTTGGSARILYPADPKEPLALRFAGSVTEAAQRGERDTWIGYECRSVVPMGRDFTADSRIAPEDRPRREPSSVVFHSSRDRSRNPGAPDAVILIHVRAEPGGGFTVLRAAGGSPTLELDPDGLPVYWLSSAGEGESVSLLAALGPHASEVHVRSKLLDIIAIHRDSAAVVSYLSDVLDGDYVMNVRAAAVEGLAWHPSPAVVERLLNTALGDRSKLVRKEAAEALGETGANEAAAALDEIIRSQNVPVDTRVEAVEALGSIHRPDILRRLTSLAFGPYDRKIQDEAGGDRRRSRNARGVSGAEGGGAQASRSVGARRGDQRAREERPQRQPRGAVPHRDERSRAPHPAPGDRAHRRLPVCRRRAVPAARRVGERDRHDTPRGGAAHRLAARGGGHAAPERDHRRPSRRRGARTGGERDRRISQRGEHAPSGRDRDRRADHRLRAPRAGVAHRSADAFHE
jgi:hypothetical protein